ncbi:MAG: cbb3-type cytochrome c oxidase subunit II [Steroidobacteraceae bacterium]|jgi:cytochrome c oxidase cbb3-type subunit II
MNFREYKIGSRMFGVALGGSMTITLLLPALDISKVDATPISMDKQLTAGYETGFNLYDPLLLGHHKPLKVLLKTDPKTGQPMEPTYAYVYEKGTPFPGGIMHPDNLGPQARQLSLNVGKIAEAHSGEGAVFVIKTDDQKHPYIEDATVTQGWQPDAVIKAAGDENISHAGAGKTLFVREGCWWCHTLLPEQTQDWQVFGAPPMLGDFNGESPTAFGSDRKAPDLLHVGSRNSSREWMMMHFFNPRLVQPHSIMPRFDYLWGEVDADGKKIDYAKWDEEFDAYRAGKRDTPPDVPTYAPNSEARWIIDFALNLK